MTTWKWAVGLLCAVLWPMAAFAAAPTKPADTTETRNVYAPLSYKLAVGFPFNDAAGTALNKVGRATGTAPRDSGDVKGGGSSWGTVDGETCLNVGANTYVEIGTNSSGSAYSFPRGTLLMRYSVGAVDSARLIAAIGGKVSGTTGAGELEVKQLVTGAVQVIYHGTSFVPKLVCPSGTENEVDKPITMVLSWGERGTTCWFLTSKGRLITTEGDGWNIGPIVIPDGEEAAFCGTPGLSTTDMKAFAFAWWDWQMDDYDVELLLADPYLWSRPSPTWMATWAGLQVSLPTPTGCTLSGVVDANPGTNKRIRVRVGGDADPCLLSTTTTFGGSADLDNVATQERVDIAVTGLTGTHYAMPEYSADSGTTWYPFPAGRARLVQQKTTTGSKFRFAVSGDSHCILPAVGWGPEYGYEDDLYASEENEQARILQHRFERALIYRGDYDFHVWLGDDTFTANQSLWRNYFARLHQFCPQFFCLGNWEGENGSFYLTPSDSQRDAAALRKRFVANPTDRTYVEGGEYEVVAEPPADPAGMDQITSWIPDIAANATTHYDSFVYEYPAAATHTAKLGYHNTPLENYYAFTWGDCLIVVLDPYRWSMGPTRKAKSYWQLGDRQMTWLRNVLLGSTAKWKVVICHQLVGGLNNRTDEDPNWYGRGSGASITNDGSLEWELHNLFREAGITCYVKGHDHNFSHVVVSGVNYITLAPSAYTGATGVAGETGRLEYGSIGSCLELQADERARGIRFGRNIHKGYCEFEVDGTTSFTVRFRQNTVGDGNWKDPLSALFPPYSFWIGPVQSIATAATTVTLDERPLEVLAVCSATDGDYQAHWPHPYTGTPIKDNWGGAGDVNIHNPSFSAGSGLALLPCDMPYGDETITIDSVPGLESVRVNYAPRTIYETTLVNAPGPGGGMSITGESGEHRGTGSYSGETGVHKR